MLRVPDTVLFDPRVRHRPGRTSGDADRERLDSIHRRGDAARADDRGPRSLDPRLPELRRDREGRRRAGAEGCGAGSGPPTQGGSMTKAALVVLADTETRDGLGRVGNAVVTAKEGEG